MGERIFGRNNRWIIIISWWFKILVLGIMELGKKRKSEDGGRIWKWKRKYVEMVFKRKGRVEE